MSTVSPAASRASSETFLQPFVDRGEVAGAVMLVADRDRILDVTAVGQADLAARTPMRPGTMFWIASMAKPITATALMMLVDEGKLDLNDPVEKYLPEFQGQMVVAEQDAEHVLLRPPAHPITVRNVLSHTSGLPFGSLIEHPTRDNLPLWATVRSYAMMPLLFEPDTGYQYSNAGTNTAGRLIEVLSGMAYEDFLQTRLFDPLGMTDMTFWPSEEQVSRMAKVYRVVKDEPLQEIPISQVRYPLSERVGRYPFPGGGLFSTAADCAKFCRMLLCGGMLDGKRYVSESAIQQMSSRHTALGVPESYGLGWEVHQDERWYGHGGACATFMSIHPEQGLATVFLVQISASEHIGAIRETFRRMATGQAVH